MLLQSRTVAHTSRRTPEEHCFGKVQEREFWNSSTATIIFIFNLKA